MSSEATPWRPILEGDSGARAAQAVTELARILAEPEALPPASLASGGPGLALFFAYLARARPGQGHEARASRFLDDAIDALAVETLDASLYAGFTGVAWTAEHLDGSDEADDPVQEIDGALLEHLARSPWTGDHDLVSGLAGAAVYALERMPRRSARACLELIFDRLEETAERRAGMATWKTGAALASDASRRHRPHGQYDVGVAHGVPGLVAILAAMAAAGIGGGRARTLFEQATAWVQSCRLPDEPGRARFPYFAGPDITPAPARFGWCYGDPGVAAALLTAARSAGDESLAGEALALARRAAAEPATRPDVTDAALCHGAAGVAHIFNRIHQVTGDATCAGAARRWFGRALEFETGGPGLITGAAGTGLALLAATSAVEPAWDRLLLVSSRPVDRLLDG